MFSFRIGEHEEILDISCAFFQKVLDNDPNLFTTDIINSLCKTYLKECQKLEDISFSVGSASKLLGYLFMTMHKKGVPAQVSHVESIKTVMIKFFFHYNEQVKTDIFYLLSNWLIFESKRIKPENLKSIKFLIKMNLTAIYIERNPERLADLITHFKACINNFDEDLNFSIIEQVKEFCFSSSIKSFLKILEDKDAEELVQNSKSWAQTTEELVDGARLLGSLGEILWTIFENLKPVKVRAFCKIETSSDQADDNWRYQHTHEHLCSFNHSCRSENQGKYKANSCIGIPKKS